MKDDYVFPRGVGNPGIELRDLFAGFALAGIISRMSEKVYDLLVDSEDCSCEAGDAYRIANYMMNARRTIDESECIYDENEQEARSEDND